ALLAATAVSCSPARVNASFHDAGSSSPARRTRGVTRRWLEVIASNEKRSLSDSQPWLGASLSAPVMRTTSFWLHVTETLECTASTSDTLSTASKSHGLARKR